MRLSSKRPSPVGELLDIQASLVSVVLSPDSLFNELLACARTLVTKPLAHVVNGQNRERETVCFVPDRKLKRGVDVALLFVATNVEEVLTRAVVGQTVHQPRVGVERKHNRLVVGEESAVFSVCQTMGVVAVGDELEQIDQVDEADIEIGEVGAQ